MAKFQFLMCTYPYKQWMKDMTNYHQINLLTEILK